MKKLTFYFLSIVFSLSVSLSCSAQKKLSELDWDDVIDQPDKWFGTDESKRVAENVLLYQRDIGGWQKNTDFHLELTEKQKAELIRLKSDPEVVTTDNSATVGEMKFMSKMYEATGDKKYKVSFLKALDYLFEAQYENGGWPQKYPIEKDEYSKHITYNDNSMRNIMEVMLDVAEQSDEYSIKLDKKTRAQAQVAFDKGIEIILKTQYVQNGVLSVWCAQHDEVTLLPAKARSYELPSLSGGESPGLVRMLMELDNPSKEVINSIQAAVKWYDKSKISGIRIQRFTNDEGKRDRHVVKDENAPPMWGRFYNLSDNRPYFCDRDGIKKYSLEEIGHERRNGYSWYVYGPQSVLDEYKEWQPKWVKDNNVLIK